MFRVHDRARAKGCAGPRLHARDTARFRVRVTLAAAVGELLLTGCVHYEPRPLSPVDRAAAFASRSLDSPDLRDFLAANRTVSPEEWPLRAWDGESLILAAFHYHPDLAVARAEWASVRAAVVTAGKRPGPSLDFTPQYNTSTSPGLVSPWILPIEFGVDIETGGKRGARVRRAEQRSRSSWWSIATSAWRVRQGVQTSLLRLQETGRAEALLEDRVRVQRELTESLQRRFDEGDVPQWELARSRTASRSLHLAYLDARREASEARARLAGAIGVAAAALDDVAFRFVPLDAAPPAIPSREARQQALVNRTDILAALADYEAAQEALRLEVARQYPDIHLGPGYEFDQGDSKWTLGIGIAFPAFDGNRGPIGEAAARRDEAAARFEALQARVLGEIDLALATYGPQQEQVDAAASMVAAAMEQEERALARQQAGDLSRFDVLLARAETLRAREDLLRARVARRRAYFDLENALQSPAHLPASFSDAPSALVSSAASERSDP